MTSDQVQNDKVDVEMKKFKFFTTIAVACWLFFGLVIPVGAQGNGISNPVLSNSLSDLSGGEFLNKLISLGISVGFLVAAVIFVFMFIMGGIRWITSEGDKTKVETARNQITHALIGLLLTFFLFVILEIIEQFFGISLKELKIPSLTD